MNVFSAHYFPCIRYISDFINVENRVIDTGENFQKQTYRNRMYILSPNGRQKLIIPIEHDGSRKMKDIKISYSHDWQKEHFRSLEAAYRRSPYFEYYEDEIQSIYRHKVKYLIDLNLLILERILKMIQYPLSYKNSEIYIENPEKDFRDVYSAKEIIQDLPEYFQVFNEKMDFVSDLSILDLLFNQGSQTLLYLKKLKEIQ